MPAEEKAQGKPVLDRSRTVLLVSEDPGFIVDTQARFRPDGIRVIGCLGPGQDPCQLDSKGMCSLTSHSSVVVIDSPASGVFGRRWKTVPVGTYAEHLAAVHQDAFIILCGAPIGASGPTGEVAHVGDRTAATELIGWFMGRDRQKEQP